jgi:uncharacterized membrane protein HdeD (DUF308 family)
VILTALTTSKAATILAVGILLIVLGAHRLGAGFSSSRQCSCSLPLSAPSAWV